jgi:hypothetical protein
MNFACHYASLPVKAVHTVNQFIHKISIIGISQYERKQRFLITEEAKLVDVKPCVKRNLKVLLQDSSRTVIHGELTFTKRHYADRYVGIVRERLKSCAIPLRKGTAV